MGPPLIQGVPAVPKMGVRARVTDWSQRRDDGDVQPPPRCDSLAPTSLTGSNMPMDKSLDQQTESETRHLVCDRHGSPTTIRTMSKMKRSNSEVTISNGGDEALDTTGVNPNTGASLRRAYGSTSTLDPSTETLRKQYEPSAPPSEPSRPPHSVPIAQVDLIHTVGLDRPMDASVYGTDQDLMLSAVSRQSRQDARFTVTPHKCFSHYDVQSVLLGISVSSLPRGLRTDSQALRASRCSDSSSQTLDGGDDLDALGDADDGKNSSLVVGSPFFCNEIGGETERTLGLTRVHSTSGSGEAPLAGQRTNAGVAVLEGCREKQAFPLNLMNNCGIEYVDRGASYYLKYFYSRDHQNYFGFDENFGPVSLSVRREKLESGSQYNYRIILRTSQVFTLRGSILENSIPSSSKHGTSRGLPLKDVLEFVLPELKVESLRRASGSPRVSELLLQLDQQELSFQFSVDVQYCQTTEDQIGGPALDQFLNLLAHKAPQESLSNCQGGSRSVFTKFREFDLKFIVSALQPRTATNSQQLVHNGRISNVVTVVFQEPEDPPFNPQTTHLHLHRVFIVVRVHRPCSQHTCFSVAVSRCLDVPPFGPLIPSGWMFPASPAFRDFLLTKVINAQHAVRRSDTFVTKATCNRKQCLEELVENFSTPMPVESSSSTRFSFIPFSVKKKERSARCAHAHLESAGALTWIVTVPDFSRSAAVSCRLAISRELVALIEDNSRQVVFSCHCRDVIGWSSADGDVKVFYQRGDCLMLSTQDGRWEDIHEITNRLQLVTSGTAAVKMTLRRNLAGQLGFHVNFEGIVADVEAHSCAWDAGLRSGSRLVEICSVALVTLSHEQMIELLRRSAMVSLVVIPPRSDGTPRRSFSETFRVPMFEFSDVTFCPLQVAPPTWHHVAVAPPTPNVPSNHNAGSAPVQQLSAINPRSMFSMTEGTRVPDWPISCDEFLVEKSRGSKSEENKSHHQPPAVMKVLRQFEPSDSEGGVTQQRGKNFSSYSNCNTLSSSSSDTQPTHRTGASLDSGIDSALCVSSAPPPLPAGTLVLRDVWVEGQSRATDPKASAHHLMERSESCCLFRDSPEPSFTSTKSSAQEKLRPQEDRSLKVISSPDRDECVKMMRCDVTAGLKSSLLPLSPWRSLTRSLSEDSLYRTLSHTGSQTSLLSDLQMPSSLGAPSTLRRNKLNHSDSSLAERGRMSLSRGSSQLLRKHLRDVTQTLRAAGLFSDLRRLSHAVATSSESSALQDSVIPGPSLSGKVVQLEEVLRRLQFDLLQEQQDKATLLQQVQSLRQDNLRLQEESQTTAEQVRRFAAWMRHQGPLP